MGMMNVPEMRRLHRVQRFDFWIAVAAIIGTLAFGVLAGVIIGIGLSLLWLVAVATHPQMPILGREPGTRSSATWSRTRRTNRSRRSGPPARRWAVLRDGRRAGGPVRELIQADPRCIVVLDCEGINFLDSQGSATIDESSCCAGRRT